MGKITIEAYGMEIEGLLSSTSETCYSIEILSPFKLLLVHFSLSKRWWSKEQIEKNWAKHCEREAKKYLLNLFILCCYFKDDPDAMLNSIKKKSKKYLLFCGSFDLNKLNSIYEKGLIDKPDFCIINISTIKSIIKMIELERVNEKIKKAKEELSFKEDIKQQRLQESLEKRLETKSVLLALQDWDSGGPGAGAGEVVLYLLDRKCYLSDDSGISEYREEQIEKALKSILRITDATRRVIVTEELRRVLISIGSTETAEGLFKNYNNIKKVTKRKGLVQYSMHIK